MQINHYSATNMAEPIATKMEALVKATELGGAGGRLGSVSPLHSCTPRPAAEGDVRGAPWGDMPGSERGFLSGGSKSAIGSFHR